MKRLTFLVFFLFSFLLKGQELPPIIKYTSEDYNADNQNWKITQDARGFIYAANNQGILKFDGARWTKYDSPNGSIMRVVKVIDSVIYSGCFTEFGYWTEDVFGNLEYNSLLPLLSEPMLEDEQVWNILAYEEWVVFQSNRALYFYNKTSQSIRKISSKNLIYKLFILNDSIYYHVDKEGIYAIVNGSPQLVIPAGSFNNDRIIGIYALDNYLCLISRNSGFFRYKDDNLQFWPIPDADILKGLNIFSSIQLKDKSFVLGTISNGLLHFNPDGTFKYKINQKKGLGNNTVLSLFEDENQNVWVGLDNGINCINVQSPIKSYADFEGMLGTVYTSIVFDNYLYLGTNQGIFYKELDSKRTSFQFIQGTAGQVLCFYIYNNQELLCGHHLGTFLIDKDKATRISNQLGSWNLKPIPGKTDILLQGNYNGLYPLKKTNNTWELQSKIEGFNNSSRYFEFVNQNQILVSHEYKGVFDLQLDDSLKVITKQKLLPEVNAGKNASLASYQGRILYASDHGVYAFDKTADIFKKDEVLSSIYDTQNYTSGKLVVDEKNRLWMFNQESIKLIETDNLTNTPRISTIPIPEDLRKGAIGYENINLIEDETYLLGTSEGYLTIDISNRDFAKEAAVYINQINVKDVEATSSALSPTEYGVLKNSHGTLTFQFAVPQYQKYIQVNYQYLLKGFQNKWSTWSTSSEVSFENLPFGNYEFLVRARVGEKESVNTASYKFEVDRPWFLSWPMIAVYVIFLLIVIIITHRAYRSYYTKKLEREQLENQQKIMKIQNEKLNQDIENRNRELAISTMSIIKKNEALSKIKKELSKDKNPLATTDAIDLIDRQLNNTKDWKFFKQAFNNADKDFLDKIKQAHPDLTPNDLRFCAYLRLNLTSKEIAPLLNISTKSVETKRYRLRKRLNLDHDDSLVNYILKF